MSYGEDLFADPDAVTSPSTLPMAAQPTLSVAHVTSLPTLPPDSSKKYTIFNRTITVPEQVPVHKAVIVSGILVGVTVLCSVICCLACKCCPCSRQAITRSSDPASKKISKADIMMDAVSKTAHTGKKKKGWFRTPLDRVDESEYDDEAFDNISPDPEEEADMQQLLLQARGSYGLKQDPKLEQSPVEFGDLSERRKK